MILIGTAGPAGAGKDTVADYLVKHHGFEKMAFAGPLKTMLASVGLAEPADRALKEQLIEGFEFTWRDAAQKLGTEWGRALDPNIWLKLTKLRIDVVRNTVQALREQGYGDTPEARIVLTDLRFDNEAAMTRNLGGTVWHITGRRADLGANAGHASEAGVQFYDGDRIIRNDKDMCYLEHQIEVLLQPLKGTE